MTLYVTLTVNDEPIGSASITRGHDDNGTDLDAVNRYVWRYHVDGDVKAAGWAWHRYGDGAAALAGEVLKQAAAQHKIAGECGKIGGGPGSVGALLGPGPNHVRSG